MWVKQKGSRLVSLGRKYIVKAPCKSGLCVKVDSSVEGSVVAACLWLALADVGAGSECVTKSKELDRLGGVGSRKTLYQVN